VLTCVCRTKRKFDVPISCELLQSAPVKNSFELIGAVVSRGGRPELAGDALPKVKSSTLLIVGGLDYPVIRLNEDAYSQLRCEKELTIVPGASHLFEEPGTLDEVAHLAAEWFQRHLVAEAA